MKTFLKGLTKAFIFSIGMFVICGLIYPLALTGVAQIIFPDQSNGSLIYVNDTAVGSKYIGQDFTDERLFHCRPSAYNYNTYTQQQLDNNEYAGLSSGSTNYANSNPNLEKRIKEDVDAFLVENPTISKESIPSDIITASGSGLDPHISVEAANIQIDRIVKNTGLSKDTIDQLIHENTEPKLLGIFGEDKVNVLLLNLDIAKEIGMIY